MKKTSAILFVLIMILSTFSIFATPVKTQEPELSTDWPMFRHDLRHTGYSTSKAPATNKTLWVYATGGPIATSSPVVADGIVYIQSVDGNLYALNMDTGELMWSFVAGNVHRTPAVTGGVVYVPCGEPVGGKVYALNATTGAFIWSYDTGHLKIGTEIAVSDDRVIFGSFDRGEIFALNASTGTLIWKRSTSSSLVSSSPAVVGGIVYIGVYWENKVYAMNASTGEVLWQYETGGVVGPSPSVVKGIVYVGSHDNKIHAINATTGEQIWTYTTGNWVRYSTAVAHGVVYVGSNDGKFYALNATTGVLKWVQTIGEASSPAVADGKIYLGSYDYRIYCLNETTGATIWTYMTGAEVLSSPAIADGKVFIGSNDGKVYCFGLISCKATIDIDPDTLNLKSNGEWITCYIELPASLNIGDVDVNMILLNGTIGVDLEAPTQIGDYDFDGIADLMVKFDRSTVIDWLRLADYSQDTGKSFEVNLKITGRVTGTPFEGADTVKVLLKG